jgi:hypothetical protein
MNKQEQRQLAEQICDALDKENIRYVYRRSPNYEEDNSEVNQPTGTEDHCWSPNDPTKNDHDWNKYYFIENTDLGTHLGAWGVLQKMEQTLVIKTERGHEIEDQEPTWPNFHKVWESTTKHIKQDFF